MEIIYEDTKAITGAEPNFKWGQMFHMLKEKKVPEAGLEELALYENILRYGITKVATRPRIIPCAEVIGWILPRIDTTGMIMNDVENKSFTYFAPAFISTTYILPKKETNLIIEWVKSLNLDYTATTKMMVAEGKTFQHKQSRDYETAHLRTPFRIITLMLSKLYGRLDGKIYNFAWIPLMYYVAMEGRIFNWAGILSKSLAKCIKATQEGL